MIKSILLWLISFYLKPAITETKTPEVDTMSEPLVEAAALVPAPALVPISIVVEPAAEAKAGVADLDAALNFIESGVAQLGEAAKDELKELAKKYL